MFANSCFPFSPLLTYFSPFTSQRKQSACECYKAASVLFPFRMLNCKCVSCAGGGGGGREANHAYTDKREEISALRAGGLPLI